MHTSPPGFIDLHRLYCIPVFPAYCLLLPYYEVVVATSAMTCKKGFAPHTGARAIPPTLPIVPSISLV